jgi:hypothetical protein
MGCFTKQDPCACSPCNPCALPAANLHYAWKQNCFSGATTGTATVVYQGVIAGVPTWQTACIAVGGPAGCQGSFAFAITCDPAAGTTYQVTAYSNPGCGAGGTFSYSWNSLTGASGITVSGSSTCSPLNLVITGTYSGTITP